MTEKTFLAVEKATIAVFDAPLRGEFNDWTRHHVAQGFTWRKGSVSFGTILDGGLTEFEVEMVSADRFSLSSSTERAILVPFTVSGEIRITTINYKYQEPLNIPIGEYQLVYENKVVSKEEETMWCRLTFVPGKVEEAQILRADPELSPIYPLLMVAQGV